MREPTVKIITNLRPNSKNAVIIINPVSGKGDAKRKKAHVLKLAKDYGFRGKVYETSPTLSASKIAEQAIKSGAKHLVVCGGDGTIMEVIQRCFKTDVVLGIVPFGTGNLLSKNLNLPSKLEDSLKVALTGKIVMIDIGRANGIFFAIIAGIGLDAEIMEITDRHFKNRLGFTAYVIGWLRSLRKSSGIYKISIDGNKAKKYKAKSVMIANMGRIQTGLEAVPKTSANNGILRIGVMQASGFLTWIDLITNALKGNINKSRHYKLHTGKRVSIISLRGKKSFQCDGENFPPTDKLTVQIYPQILPIMLEE